MPPLSAVKFSSGPLTLMKMKPKKILIVGLGLMGASLAAALRRQNPLVKIAAVSRNRAALALALKKKWIHEGSQELEKVINGVDFAVLCTPVDVEAAQLARIDRAARQPLVVTDVGSVKGALCSQLSRKKFKYVSFIPAHPMVGSHEQGAKAARENLYTGGLVFVIQAPRQSRQALEAVRGFWTSLGMKLVSLTASRHDAIVADISHLPHAAAACLVSSVSAAHLPFAASGFRDTTRVAAAHPSVWEPIFLANAREVDLALGRFEKHIKTLRKLIRSKDSKGLRHKLLFSSRRRQEI